jgi:2-oxoglutarate ferredoxin oxidoreductase subunit alpha
LPTRHEQGDLLYAIFMGHGEFPRIVVAPGDMTECFYDAFYAFNWADQFQMPVIVLCDKALANNTSTIPVFDESTLQINRGKLVSDAYLAELASKPDYQGQFHRFTDSPDGVSMRATLGQMHGIHWLTGDEHDTLGHITEDPDTRIKMHNKRSQKLVTALKEIPEAMQYHLYGPEDADITVVVWGSGKGPMLDAMPILRSDGITINLLQIRLMCPFPVDAVTRILNRAKVKIGLEQNYSGQLARLVRMETGIAMDHQVSKYTGRPMSETEVVSAIRNIVSQKTQKVVLSYGH